MICLIFGWTGASTVAINLVPQLIPYEQSIVAVSPVLDQTVYLLTCAPSAKAHASPRPSPNPPEAMYGILSSWAARAKRTIPPISSSPGCPAPASWTRRYQSNHNYGRSARAKILTFEPVNGEDVDSHLLRALGVSYGRALMYNDTIVFLEEFDHRARVISGRLEYFDTC